MEGSEQMVLGVGSLGDAVSVAVLVEDIDDGGFADGHWEGTLSATPIRTDVGGELETRGNTTAAPFAFDVDRGRGRRVSTRWRWTRRSTGRTCTQKAWER